MGLELGRWGLVFACLGLWASGLHAVEGARGEVPHGRILRGKVAGGRWEAFVLSKAGARGAARCEDGILIDDRFLVVVDGATDKSGRSWSEGRKGGRVARDMVLEVFRALPAGADPVAVERALRKRFRAFHAGQEDVDFSGNRKFRPTACVLWYSFARKELAAIGDCKARIEGRLWNGDEKLVDRLNADLRCRVLEALGLKASDLSRGDPGRDYILPLLEAQMRYQNDPTAPEALRYWVVDGFPVPRRAIVTKRFRRHPRLLELSSDGYPAIVEGATVAAWERGLAELLSEDPACIGRNRSTKGLRPGNVSFDDRAILIWRR